MYKDSQSISIGYQSVTASRSLPSYRQSHRNQSNWAPVNGRNVGDRTEPWLTVGIFHLQVEEAEGELESIDDLQMDEIEDYLSGDSSPR